MKAILVEKLTKKFGDFIAVNSISFEVMRGEIFGLLGANGAGKTTTIKMLCGVLAPTSGRAYIAGYDVVSDPESVKRIIGYMSQKFSLYHDLRVHENMEFYGGLYGLKGEELKRRTQEVLDLLDLTEERNTMVSELPRGIQQKVAFACALLHEPEVIFLDEPTAGVDPLERRRFWDIIYELSASGTTLIVTTHYLDEAEFCHHVAFMSSGNIIAEGSPTRLKEKLSGYDMYEIAIEPLLKGVSVLRKVDWVEWLYVFGSSVHVLVKKGCGLREALKKVLDPYEVRLISVDRIEPSLEDVFLFLGRGGKNLS